MRTLAALVCFAALGAAHELGGTRVTASFDGGRYTIEVVTDATALAEKLASLPGDAPTDAARLKVLLEGADVRFRQRVRVVFDGQQARPEIAYLVTPAAEALSAPMAAVRLTGAIPEGAREFTWSYGWTFATYSLTAGGATTWLEGGQSSAPIRLAGGGAGTGTFAKYLVLGFTHIVPHGFDHVLFVLGIYLLSRRWNAVLWQVSAFTLAHSITLGLGMYGLIQAPARVVEPLIALSIAYVAIENIFFSELRPWRVALVFGFGLLHGMGFAGVLQELGLPRGEFVTALAAFNIGVEAGQLTVIGTAFLAAGWYCSRQAWYRGRVVIPASLAIACTAIYWTIERVLA